MSHHSESVLTTSVVAWEVIALARESWSKGGTFLTKSSLANVQSTGIFCCLCNFVCEQFTGAMSRSTAGSTSYRSPKSYRRQQCPQSPPHHLSVLGGGVSHTPGWSRTCCVAEDDVLLPPECWDLTGVRQHTYFMQPWALKPGLLCTRQALCQSSCISGLV